MSFVARNGGTSTCPPQRTPPRRSRVGAVIAFAFTVFAFIVVACSGDNGVADVDEQGQAICTLDECPPPRDPCGTEGEACCRNIRCQAGLVCSSGTCTSCGVAGGPCCANNVCQAGSACQNGACVRTCGVQGLSCCNGTTCDSGLVCSGGTCNACGRGGQACCAGNTCTNGFNCNGGTCTSCGGNGQTCCASGAACGGGLYCATGNTCRPIPCGTANGPCCPGLDWQQCQLAGSQYACNETFNRCELCGGTGRPCCVSGSACTFSSTVCVESAFGGGTCQHCGRTGEPCCSGNSCQSGAVCNSSTDRCAACGGRNQPCCSGITSCQSGLTCRFGSCQ
jgi:hypothetical protein